MKMLDYQKTILEKVSFSKELFKRELSKSHKWLNLDEFGDLIVWATDNFGKIYSEIIFRVSNKYIFNYKPDLKILMQPVDYKRIDKF